MICYSSFCWIGSPICVTKTKDLIICSINNGTFEKLAFAVLNKKIKIKTRNIMSSSYRWKVRSTQNEEARFSFYFGKVKVFLKTLKLKNLVNNQLLHKKVIGLDVFLDRFILCWKMLLQLHIFLLKCFICRRLKAFYIFNGATIPVVPTKN